jgi:DedD protein
MRTAETELFKDKIEISLDGRQVFYLFFGGAVIACLVFVLGVMVGKRVEARAHVADSATTDTALDPLAALDQLDAEDSELAFPRALAGNVAPLGAVDQALVARSEAAAPSQPEAAKAPAAAKEPAPEKKAAEPPEPEAESKPEPKPEAESKPEPKPKAEPKPEPEPEASKPAEVDRDQARFTLQISSFQDRVEADTLRDQMNAAGYKPYIVEAEVPGKGIWYRVRLGFYGSYDDAIAAKQTFESDQQIIAYVTRVK